MLTLLATNPTLFVVWILALLTAITIHEFAHAYTADKLGDPTPRLQGRVTLNPLAHLDPLGTLMLLLVRFGWGKPVQFDPYNLKDPRRDAAVISLAGPISNMALATVLAIALRLMSAPFSGATFLYDAFEIFIFLNVSLAVFNLIPIHPLDGGKILVALLPRKDAYRVDQLLDQYGIFLLILLIFPIFGGTAPLYAILDPILRLILGLLLPGGPVV